MKSLPAPWPFLRVGAVLSLFTLLAASLPAAGLKYADKTFVESAGRFVNEQVAISEVVSQRTTNPRVKELAQMILADHITAQAMLAGIAAGKGVRIPASDAAAKWAKKDKGLDREYVVKMVSDQDEAVKLFMREVRDGKDGNVVAFASQTLPRVRAHLERSRDAVKSVR